VAVPAWSKWAATRLEGWVAVVVDACGRDPRQHLTVTTDWRYRMSDLTTFLQRWTDAERVGDTTRIKSMLTDDFVGIGPLGFTLPKAAWLARHETGDVHYERFDLDETDTRIHGDAAVVVARHTASGTYQGHPIPEAARATLILLREDTAWRLIGIHLSFIAGTPGAPPLPGGSDPAPSAPPR
jgi:ketosteroid isomerase-like protein